MEDSTLSPPPEPLAPTMSPWPWPPSAGASGWWLFLTLGFITQILNAAFGIWFTEIFIFLAVPWVVLRAARYEPLGYTGAQFPGLAPAALGFGLGVANFFALVVPIQYAAQSVAPQWLRDMFDGSRIFEGQSPLELTLMLAGVSVAAPVCEEFFFRGVFQKGLLASSLSRPAAVVVTAVVFSAFHMDPVGFLARVELGVLFGALRLYTGSLWPSILAHSANNVVSSFLFLSSRQMGPESADERPPLKIVLMLIARGHGGHGDSAGARAYVPCAVGAEAGAAHLHPALPFPRAAAAAVGAGGNTLRGGPGARGCPRHPAELDRPPVPPAQAAPGRSGGAQDGAREPTSAEARRLAADGHPWRPTKRSAPGRPRSARHSQSPLQRSHEAPSSSQPGATRTGRRPR